MSRSCAMNSTATTSYNAVPSMLIVAPSGKHERTHAVAHSPRVPPRKSSSVAASPLLEAELKAVSSAGLIARAQTPDGLRRATKCRIRGRMIIAWMASAHATVSMYQPSVPNIAAPCDAVAESIKKNTPTGASLIMNRRQLHDDVEQRVEQLTDPLGVHTPNQDRADAEGQAESDDREELPPGHRRRSGSGGSSPAPGRTIRPRAPCPPRFGLGMSPGLRPAPRLAPNRLGWMRLTIGQAHKDGEHAGRQVVQDGPPKHLAKLVRPPEARDPGDERRQDQRHRDHLEHAEEQVAQCLGKVARHACGGTAVTARRGRRPWGSRRRSSSRVEWTTRGGGAACSSSSGHGSPRLRSLAMSCFSPTTTRRKATSHRPLCRLSNLDQHAFGGVAHPDRPRWHLHHRRHPDHLNRAGRVGDSAVR